MENNIVINNLKNVLESTTMTTYLNSVSSESERLSWLQKALYFMISTGNYEDVYMYLLKSNDFTFPNEYLLNKNKTEKQIQALLKHNYLKNGFFYHGTSKYVCESILENGLFGLEQRYGKEFISDIVTINQLCKDIAITTEKYSFGKIILDEELPLNFLKGKFDRVYLSAEISKAFHFANNNNSWLRTFISNLLRFVKADFCYFDFNNKSNLLDQLKSALNNSKAVISNDEINVILNFINKYYIELEMTNKLKEKSIIFTKKDIKLNKIITYQDSKNRGINYILGQINTQNIYTSSVEPQDLAVLSFNDNGSLSLKLGKK